MGPCVSVVMSAYNAEAYLAEAVESILNQTFRDFEFVIIDDGSTDKTAEILARYENLDKRVRVYNQANQGLVTALNRGVGLARGRYIARMDADDISLPERLSKQLDYMESHPEVGVMGSQMNQMDEKGNPLSSFATPLSHDVIVWKMLFECAVAHATVMMRKPLLIHVGGYNPCYLHIEDTELWSRLIWVTRFANHPDCLFLRRKHKQSVCSTQAARQLEIGMAIRRGLFERILDREVKQDVVELLSRSWHAETILTDGQIKEVIALLLELYNAIIKDARVPPSDAQDILDDLLNRIVLVTSRRNRFVERAKKHWIAKLPGPVRRIGRRLLYLIAPQEI